MTKRNDAAQAAAADAALPINRIFLTGGSGYIGRNLIRYFLEKDTPVTALARSRRSAEIVSALGAQACSGDVFSGALSQGMAGCDVLIHAAADLDHGIGSVEQHRVNVEGTRAVFEAASAAGVRTAIMVSTESVLADGRPLVNVDESQPLPRRPAGSYSASKARAEQLALSFNGPDMAVTAVRPRMVWGRDDTTALPQLMDAVQSGRFAWISQGDYCTSTTHIANLCAGIDCAIMRGNGGEVFFLADEQPVQFRQFVTALLATQGISAPRKSVHRSVLRLLVALGAVLHRLSRGKVVPPLTLQAYATSAVEITLNIEKAKRELGYQPVMSREAGLAELRAARQVTS
ncbi:NAD-dependent epimerase/dehydratase family protein [Pseudorhizobium marinum]|uniref:NAD-dependent epimerase/dehydratase family protein n=1 Tax=Pseudorhizobium marinum TaxID=1496690 RepID=UPI000AB02818|nr:NAD-dependent epimerase/dehydratase family protein [Pseudorhizobium marinum]